jgi:hypothetical protein
MSESRPCSPSFYGSSSSPGHKRASSFRSEVRHRRLALASHYYLSEPPRLANQASNSGIPTAADSNIFPNTSTSPALASLNITANCPSMIRKWFSCCQASLNSSAVSACHRCSDTVQEWHRPKRPSHRCRLWLPVRMRYACKKKKVNKSVRRADSWKIQSFHRSDSVARQHSEKGSEQPASLSKTTCERRPIAEVSRNGMMRSPDARALMSPSKRRIIW